MPLEGQSTLLLLILPVKFCFYTCLHSCFFCFLSFFFHYFSGKLYLNCLILKLTQVFSLGVSSYPRLDNIGTCHSAWVTSVADKALFRLNPLFPCVYIIACCSVAFDLAYSSASNFYLICFLQFCERNFHKM